MLGICALISYKCRNSPSGANGLFFALLSIFEHVPSRLFRQYERPAYCFDNVYVDLCLSMFPKNGKCDEFSSLRHGKRYYSEPIPRYPVVLF